MIIKSTNAIDPVNWGNGLSYRVLVQADGMGFTLAHTVVRAGTRSRMRYHRHLEACYCIKGKGEIIDEHGTSHIIEPNTLYALDKHDAHTLVAAPTDDLHLISIFNPPLTGTEKHTLTSDGYSGY